MIGIVVLLLLSNAASIYAAVRLYRRNEIYEDLIVDVYDAVKDTYAYMQYIDELGAFEADDEVGHAFKELNRAIIELQKYIEIESEERTTNAQTEIEEE